MPYLFAFLSAAGFGLNDLCIHIGMRSGRVDSNQALIINLLSGNILLIGAFIIVYFTAGFPPINMPGILYFIAAGASAPFLGRIFSFTSIKHIGATRTTTLRVSDTFFTMIIAYIILNDIISIYSLIGAVILIMGVVLLVNETSDSSAADENIIKNFFSTGTFLALISAFLFAIAGIFREVALQFIPSALLGTLLGNLVAFTTNSIYIYFSGHMKGKWDITWREVFFFALGGFSNTVGVLTFFLALAAGGAVSLIAAIKNTSPLFTLLLSWLFLRNIERFTAKLFVSIILILFGALLIVV
ncbi:MAG: DMT family transporter [Clostridiales bacterium]|nr:DMT family transporter [Clostridiales bacterium]MCF8021793.1 DMT family transporter [Clostridiales bacterium]